MDQNTALVLGATGGIGGAVMQALLARGWRVQALHRNAEAQRSREPRVTWIAGDAMRADDVAAAARGVQVVVHAVNPPGYRDWDRLAVPMLDHSIAAALAADARLVLPGTVYNYGPDAFPLVSEGAVQRPLTRKGAIRVAMEQRLRGMADQGGRAMVVRAGDFFGPHGTSNWFAGALVKAGKPLRSVSYPGRAGIGHGWAYLPDLAETMARLIEREATLAPFENFHFDGHWDPDGTAMLGAIRRAAGDPALPRRWFPWPLLAAASPFVTFLREMMEMRYLWKTPVRLDNARLRAVLGQEPHTPLDAAVRTTLIGLGCLAPG